MAKIRQAKSKAANNRSRCDLQEEDDDDLAEALGSLSLNGGEKGRGKGAMRGGDRGKENQHLQSSQHACDEEDEEETLLKSAYSANMNVFDIVGRYPDVKELFQVGGHSIINYVPGRWVVGGSVDKWFI